MGVYIPNIEKPYSCYYCPFAEGSWGYSPPARKWCLATGKNMPKDKDGGQYNQQCPLIEVPDSSGRLISARAVKWAFDDAIMDEAKVTGIVRATSDEIAEVIASVPTIIPTDELANNSPKLEKEET